MIFVVLQFTCSHIYLLALLSLVSITCHLFQCSRGIQDLIPAATAGLQQLLSKGRNTQIFCFESQDVKTVILAQMSSQLLLVLLYKGRYESCKEGACLLVTQYISEDLVLDKNALCSFNCFISKIGLVSERYLLRRRKTRSGYEVCIISQVIVHWSHRLVFCLACNQRSPEENLCQTNSLKRARLRCM